MAHRVPHGVVRMVGMLLVRRGILVVHRVPRGVVRMVVMLLMRRSVPRPRRIRLCLGRVVTTRMVDVRVVRTIRSVHVAHTLV